VTFYHGTLVHDREDKPSLGIRGQGSRFRVQGSGFGVQGSGFRAKGCRLQIVGEV
jgi:hypothetical protein